MVKMRIPLADPLIEEDEAKAVFDVVKSGWIREGKFVNKFEKEFSRCLGVKHAIAVSSGTAALHVALASLGVHEGDEVILPSFTCVPPLSMTLLVGGVPVFADIEIQTYNLNPISVKRVISKRTKAIIPINYAGHPAELDILQEIAEDNGVYLLNDAAEALGATYHKKNMSAFGEISVFSFSPNKTITTGEGGMIVTNDDEIAEKARKIKDYGQMGRFNITELGSNYHLTEMQAAIGIVQLKKVDKIVKLKQLNSRLLSEKLSDLNRHIITPIELPGSSHGYCLYSIRILAKSRDDLVDKLNKVGIQSRVYFPALHRMPFIKKFNFKMEKLPNTELVSSTILSLPSSPKLSKKSIECISDFIHVNFK